MKYCSQCMHSRIREQGWVANLSKFQLIHLCKRFFSSLFARDISVAEISRVHSILSVNEIELWKSYQKFDKRHSIVVLNRLNAFMPHAGREVHVAALLHDIGKSDSRLDVFSRVIATIVGPRTGRFSRYHHHEEIGIELLEAAGCSEVTISLLKGIGDPQALAALSAADNI